MTPPPTIVLLGHGSPDPRAAAGLRSLARAVARARTSLRVEVAFLDHDEPGLTGLTADLAAEGIRRCTLVPAFLSTAFHVRADVPRVVAHAEAATGVRIDVTAALGPDTALLDLLDQRIPATAPVVLASAGTRDAAARADLERLAEQWSARRGADVVLGFAAMAEPDVVTALATLPRSDAPPVVASYVLFPGVLADRIAANAGDVDVSAPLGDDVVQLVLARVDAVS